MNYILSHGTTIVHFEKRAPTGVGAPNKHKHIELYLEGGHRNHRSEVVQTPSYAPRCYYLNGNMYSREPAVSNCFSLSFVKGAPAQGRSLQTNTNTLNYIFDNR